MIDSDQDGSGDRDGLPQRTGAASRQQGASRSAPAEAVGVGRQQQSESAEQAGSTPHGPIRLHHERDESPGGQTDASAPDQAMRRSPAGAPPAIRQAHDDVQEGRQDTDLYGSGNLASPDDKGRRPDASVDRADDRDDVRRSGHDIKTD